MATNSTSKHVNTFDYGRGQDQGPGQGRGRADEQQDSARERSITPPKTRQNQLQDTDSKLASVHQLTRQMQKVNNHDKQFRNDIVDDSHYTDGEDDDDDDDDDDQYEQAMDIFVKHFDHHYTRQNPADDHQDSRSQGRRSSLPTEDIELTTFSEAVLRRKQHQIKMRIGIASEDVDNENRLQDQQHPLPCIKPMKNDRPISISSISSAASSGSSASSRSSASSGIQSSLTRNSSLNYSQEFNKNLSYLESVDNLDNNNCSHQSIDHTATSANSNDDSLSPKSIEDAFKNLNIAQSRAAILAAGEFQRGGTNSQTNKLSRINRTFHASLRYDRSTAYRIHLMANARAFNLVGQAKSYNLNGCNTSTVSGLGDSTCEARGIFRRYSTVSRNNSSTSSDSGHFSNRLLTPCHCGANNRKFSEGAHSSTGCSSASLASTSTSKSSGNQRDESDSGALASEPHASASPSTRRGFSGKAATLDGATCQRSSSYRAHHPNCPSYSSSASTDTQSSQRPLRASPKLQQSPSSVSSYSNTSSQFRDDGFEDDLNSTASGHSSSVTGKVYHERSLLGTKQKHQPNVTQLPNNNLNYHRHRIHNDQELPLLTICQRVVTEIIETERSYVEDLEQIVSGYLCRLRDVLEQHQELFSNLEDIYKFNKDLLFQLEECYLNPGAIAACFVENAARFDVYTHYCTMYPQVVSTLTALMAQPATALLLKEHQLELNQSLPLGAYLLKPVQRILKYHILFKSLIKHAADDETVNDKDRQSINEAISVMTNIASHINEMKKRHEHSIRVQELQSLLYGWEVGVLYILMVSPAKN